MDINGTIGSADKEDEGTWINLRDEKGDEYQVDGKPVRALVRGVYSATYRRVQEKQRKENERSKNFQQLLANGDRQTRERHVALVARWDLTDNGVSADPAKVFKAAPWIEDQIVEAGDDHARFFESASAS